MKPPDLFKYYTKRKDTYSLCRACDKWKLYTAIFQHEGRLWHLCLIDFYDYWENTDVLLSDYVRYR